jgi:hypothetical protein
MSAVPRTPKSDDLVQMAIHDMQRQARRWKLVFVVALSAACLIFLHLYPWHHIAR